jgi:hypothetical protein
MLVEPTHDQHASLQTRDYIMVLLNGGHSSKYVFHVGASAFCNCSLTLIGLLCPTNSFSIHTTLEHHQGSTA